MLRRRVFWIPLVLVILIIAGGTWLVFGRSHNSGPPPELAAIKSGTIQEIVSASGTVMPASDTTMTFKVSGYVASVDVKRGDIVHKGDVLATLDTKELELQVEQAQAQLQSAQAQLDKVKAGATQADIAAAEANVASAQAKLHSTMTNNVTPQDIQSAQAALDSAEAQLAQVQNPATTEDLASAKAKVNQAQANLDKVKSSMSAAKTQAQLAWEQSAGDVRTAQANYNLSLRNYEKARDTGADPVTGRSINDLQIDQYKTTMETDLLTEQKAEQAMAKAQTAYEDAKNQETTAIQVAQGQLDDAAAALQKLQAGSTPEDLQVAQAAVDQAQANLDKLGRGPEAPDVAAAQEGVRQADAALADLQAGPKQSDLEVGMASVSQADAALKLAQVNMDNARLLAPYDGVVAAVDISVGDPAGPGGQGVEIVDASELHLDTNVAEADIASVKPGQVASISLDGLPGKEISGTVDFIAPNAKVSQNVVIYTVSVRLGEVSDGLKAGMSGTVNITVLTKSGVLLVPNRAVQASGGQQMVQVYKNETITDVPITLGLSNDTESEVLSGLSEGDQVVVNPSGVQRANPFASGGGF